jgi:hypothetical protein
MGKFQKGNPGGPGRPPKTVEDAQHSALLDLFDEQEERAVIATMIANAKRRGVVAAPSAISAATWLWDRKYGKVKDQVEQSGGLVIKVVYADSDADTP